MFLPPITKPVLYLPAKLYEFGVRLRIRFYERGVLKSHRLETPVISVGNLTVGGTGKTPCTAALAQMLRDAGLDVAILSRGYKRASAGRVEVSNIREILAEPEEAGDEPYLLARACPGVRVIADRDRYAAGRWIEQRARPSVFLLDDGFQHLRLRRNIDLLLIDGRDDLSKAEMVPFGRLREPLTGLRRASAVIVTRSDPSMDRTHLEKTIRRYAKSGIPIYYSDSRISSLFDLKAGSRLSSDAMAGKRIAAFAGVARPERFFDDLEGLNVEIALRRVFNDHHRYTSEELLEIAGAARLAGAEAMITTEKDAANFPRETVALIELPLLIAQLEFRWERPDAIRAFALDAMKPKTK